MAAQQPSFDPGLTQKYGGRLRRTINPDGSFNVLRRGFAFRDAGYYHFLTRLSWPRFLALLVAGYFAVNLLFAGIYMAAGLRHIHGADTHSPAAAFQNAFFFSVATLTTVGYGNMVPEGWLLSTIAALETMTGLLSFALGTGLLFARFARASANLEFSRQALIAPFQGRAALMFRVANRRPNVLVDLEARVLLMTVEDEGGEMRRRYRDLTLERPFVHFLALTWTVVHPVDEASPLWGRTAADLARAQAEILVLIKAFDDTYGQTVHARYSYPLEELAWGSRFLPAFYVNHEGELVLELDRVHAAEPAELPAR